jgi:hypothetical protein
MTLKIKYQVSKRVIVKQSNGSSPKTKGTQEEKIILYKDDLKYTFEVKKEWTKESGKQFM